MTPARAPCVRMGAMVCDESGIEPEKPATHSKEAGTTMAATEAKMQRVRVQRIGNTEN